MADLPEPTDSPGGPGLARLNAADPADTVKLLGEVCASRGWIDAVAARRPYRDLDELYAASDLAMSGLTSPDLDEAMAGHAVIGRPRANDEQSEREQAGVRGADDGVLTELADANQEYFDRFGHVFLICATGRGAAEMLDALRVRLGNDAATERENAREELRKINRIRLEKLVQA
ncbi:2-oxo-4-hydroxy-4-carboxy-5-ureidoimidazoline decarboxylase [Yinghuangia seranimata]|uniref:2-oxo-4-hydroxy-4-carboxy-5-ureidoimidazoline decarboxylase n=1 Tax=Yinghuangia seranimata TaxID=408067 RepID=UPI00248C4B42|nr:2-oxo-4-hydroxy-4-carboxy-5-ureidoimidazoline decarboxylase [Yinghuangia seranimata]MDI2131520.1 2-oxo-4-hydroxy-4-carboxy-5-ureidoimidazoline decarboxylase [Yinghuangia seranimata]